jgi:hypothetical protein
MKKKRLPIGNSDFKEIIEENYYYVDKSLLIQELLDDGSKITLVTRPRRFGKTLNLMMLKYWFEKFEDLGVRGQSERVLMSSDGLRYTSSEAVTQSPSRIEAQPPTDTQYPTPNAHLFKHLKIWQLGEEYTRHCGKYPVVYLSLKDVKDENWEKSENHTGILRVSATVIPTIYGGFTTDLNNPSMFTILEYEYADKFGILESEVIENKICFGIPYLYQI